MRLIDADALEKELASWICDDRGGNLTYQQIVNNEAIVDAMRITHDAPTVEPMRKKGKWINNSNGVFGCDQCGHRFGRSNFCPNCGADMRGGDDE